MFSVIMFQQSKSKQHTLERKDLFHYGETSRRTPYETLSNGTLYLKKLNSNTDVNMDITTLSVTSDKSLRCILM